MPHTRTPRPTPDLPRPPRTSRAAEAPARTTPAGAACTAGPTDLPLLDETIGANLRRNAAEHAGRTAVVEAATGRAWTYAELDAASDHVARGLLAAGLEIGDRVGIWSTNCAEWTLVQYAASKAGAVLVNLNPAYRSHELTYVVEQCGMRMLVVAPNDERSDYAGIARGVRDATRLEQLVFLPATGGLGAGSAGGVGDGEYDAAGPLGDGESTLAGLVAAGERSGDAAAELDRRTASLAPDDPINLQYTSGTTGFPKGATLTHRNILNNGFHIGELLAYGPADRVVIPVPFFHCFGMVIGNLAALSHGAATIIPGRFFKPDEALAAVERFGGTSLYGVPTMFIAELALPGFADYDLSTLRTGVMAGSTCPVEVMERVIGEMNMAEVAICYGMTETSPVSTMTRTDDSLERRTQTVGRTMPHLESRIVDPGTGETVARGEAGELCTRGYAVMRGYWGEPEKTEAAIDADCWMHTGDLAVMDDDGYVRIEGRIKDLIIRGGENISPREIEEFLHRHPDIQDVQVIGVPDERYGEEVMACIIPHEGAAELTAEELREYCVGRIAHYKIPRYVQIRSSFPMTVSGKVRKVEMRQEALDVVRSRDGV